MQITQQYKSTAAEKVHSSDVPTWEEIIDVPNFFEDCFTTDPKMVLGAWDKLSRSILKDQLAAFPACVYFGLKETFDEHFKERKSNINQTPIGEDKSQGENYTSDVVSHTIKDSNSANPTPKNQNKFAEISQFNERLDVVLSTIERYNPGYLKRTTDNIENFDEIFRDRRFEFGGKQAYTSLVCSWVGIISCFPAFLYVIFQDITGFWNTTLIVLMLIASQSGFSGFMRIIDGFSQLLNSFRRKE